jgi:hypothetical protein
MIKIFLTSWLLALKYKLERTQACMTQKSLYVGYWSTVNRKRPLNMHACTKFPPSLLYISLQFASTKHNILFLTGESLRILKSKNGENFVPLGLFGDWFGPYKVNWA